jgi:hypothetical protein
MDIVIAGGEVGWCIERGTGLGAVRRRHLTEAVVVLIRTAVGCWTEKLSGTRRQWHNLPMIRACQPDGRVLSVWLMAQGVERIGCRVRRNDGCGSIGRRNAAAFPQLDHPATLGGGTVSGTGILDTDLLVPRSL